MTLKGPAGGRAFRLDVGRPGHFRRDHVQALLGVAIPPAGHRPTGSRSSGHARSWPIRPASTCPSPSRAQVRVMPPTRATARIPVIGPAMVGTARAAGYSPGTNTHAGSSTADAAMPGGAVEGGPPPDHGGSPFLVAPGTYGELLGKSGRPWRHVQLENSTAVPTHPGCAVGRERGEAICAPWFGQRFHGLVGGYRPASQQRRPGCGRLAYR